jgi:HPt (histidine-containing phosphotransfer) domain-containing protein
MTPTDVETEFVASELAESADLRELIELFVDDLPQRLAAMRAATRVGDLDSVGRLAHQLKGAGGSYGFPVVSGAALDVELAARRVGSASVVSASLDVLEAICNRVRA